MYIPLSGATHQSKCGKGTDGDVALWINFNAAITIPNQIMPWWGYNWAQRGKSINLPVVIVALPQVKIILKFKIHIDILLNSVFTIYDNFVIFGFWCTCLLRKVSVFCYMINYLLFLPLEWSAGKLCHSFMDTHSELNLWCHYNTFYACLDNIPGDWRLVKLFSMW